jgi:hypothetical protein
MRFFTRSIITLACLTLLAGAASAQDGFVLEGEQATLQMDVPSGWGTQITDSAVGLYGIMSNATTDEPRSDVQVVFRHAEDLLGVLNEPIDVEAENPAYDYLVKYATRYAERLEGSFGVPQTFITADDIPGAAMLYIERTDSARLGQGVDAALSLSLVFWLGDEELLIVLFDAPTFEGDETLARWADILQTMRLNDAAPPFADDAEIFLSLFESPQSLLARYVSLQQQTAPPPAPSSTFPLPGENLTITRAGNTLLFSRYNGWTIEENDESEFMTLVSDDGSATIRLEILPLPADSEDAAAEVEAFVENHEDFQLVGDPMPFAWDPLDSAAANLIVPSEDGDALERVGQIIIGRYQVGGVMLVLLLDAEPEFSGQLAQDWRNTVSAIRFNGANLPFEPLLLTLAQLPSE